MSNEVQSILKDINGMIEILKDEEESNIFII